MDMKYVNVHRLNASISYNAKQSFNKLFRTFEFTAEIIRYQYIWKPAFEHSVPNYSEK